MSTLNEPTLSYYHFGDVIVDCANFRVEKDREIRPLTPRAFDLLVFLIEHRGRVVEKRELLDEIWKDTFVTDNALTKVVKEVRRALGDDADSPRYIETVPRRGYRFLPDVQIIESAVSAELLLNQSPAQEIAGAQESSNLTDEHAHASISSTKIPVLSTMSRPVWLALAVTLALTLTVISIVYFRKSPPEATEQSLISVSNTTQITSWSGLDLFPALSPDGNSIAYASDRSGSLDIYVKQMAPGGRDIQITTEGNNIQPTWSPDGKMIAFHSLDRGGIWVIPALGGVARRLTDFGSRPAWSPEGALIAFQSGGFTDFGPTGFTVPPSTIWVVAADGGSAREITRPGNPAGGHASPSWSPDSETVVFATYDIHFAEIWSVSVSDSSITQLTCNQPLSFDPVISPDGKYLYYSGASKVKNFYLWRVSLSPESRESIGKPVEVINTGSSVIRCPAFTVDGKRLFYSLVKMTNNIWSVPLSPVTSEATGPPVPLTRDTIFRKSFASFSPDGRHIVYSSWATGTDVDVWLMDSDGRDQRQVTTDPTNESMASWLPDGKSLIVLSDREGRRGLWEASLSDGTMRFIIDYTKVGPNPKVSPDGKTVAFHSNQGGVTNISAIGLEGGESQQLTFDKEMMGFPTWSPDGKLMALEMKRGDDTHLAVIPSSGGAPVQLTFERGQSWTGGWSPDGQKIAFAGYRNGRWNVWWVTRDGRTQKQITQFTSPNIYVRYPIWSPAGEKIVYEYAEINSNIWSIELK